MMCEQCVAIKEKLAVYEKWFTDNAVMLAMHNIGGYRIQPPAFSLDRGCLVEWSAIGGAQTWRVVETKAPDIYG